MRLRRFPILTDRKGSVLVETAIALPLLILVMSGIIDFGYQFAVSNSMQSVSNETARLVAIRRLTAAEAPAYAQGRLMKALGPYSVTASVSGSDAVINITIPRRDAALIDVLGIFRTGNLAARSTMRLIS